MKGVRARSERAAELQLGWGEQGGDAAPRAPLLAATLGPDVDPEPGSRADPTSLRTAALPSLEFAAPPPPRLPDDSGMFPVPGTDRHGHPWSSPQPSEAELSL